MIKQTGGERRCYDGSILNSPTDGISPCRELTITGETCFLREISSGELSLAPIQPRSLAPAVSLAHSRAPSPPPLPVNLSEALLPCQAISLRGNASQNWEGKRLHLQGPQRAKLGGPQSWINPSLHTWGSYFHQTLALGHKAIMSQGEPTNFLFRYTGQPRTFLHIVTFEPWGLPWPPSG